MDQQTLLERCQSVAYQLGSIPFPTADASEDTEQNNVWGPEDAIGFFQALRPDGVELKNIFEDVPHGGELEDRLSRVYELAGDPTRPDGARDAYFVVRKPVRLSVEVVEHAGKTWLNQLEELDRRIGAEQLANLVAAKPEIRILEGQPPKHPRRTGERCNLLNLILGFSKLHVEPLEPQHDTALALRRACYFIACDAMLCDYLLWPVYRDLVSLEDPFEPYFTLWQAGIKFRIFNDQTVDFYMPRQN